MNKYKRSKLLKAGDAKHKEFPSVTEDTRTNPI